MMITLLAAVSCLLAFGPAALFIRNLFLYRRLPAQAASGARCSVLIPARNEERRIAAALQSVLESRGVELEVIVLDDGSTDETAVIVRQMAARDGRVRLIEGESLPAGWCGKNFASQQLTEQARHPLFLFLDADVRITSPDAIARLAEFVRANEAALVSTVPRQETKTLAEKMIVPLIHFVLLGFLPLQRMRATTDPRFTAACGQVLAVRREAYEASGGHAAIAGKLHDAMALAREFRRRDYRTDLFDGTDTFACRMYETATEVWAGFAKNAREGLGSPRLILPSTLLLFGGQVLPFVLLWAATSRLTIIVAALGAAAVLLPRIIAVFRFRQSVIGAFLHPLGTTLLIAIQWFALWRRFTGRGAIWKGRAYRPSDTLRSLRA